VIAQPPEKLGNPMGICLKKKKKKRTKKKKKKKKKQTGHEKKNKMERGGEPIVSRKRKTKGIREGVTHSEASFNPQ